MQAAFNAIADSADAFPAAALDPADALTRADRVVWRNTNRLSAQLQANVSGPWGEELLVLRDLAVEYGGELVAALRTAINGGAILGLVNPTRDRLPGMVADYGKSHRGSVHVEEYGEDDEQTLVEQFAMALMLQGAQVPGVSRSQDELIRDSFSVIGAAATLIAAIDERPPLHREWDD